LIYPFFDRLLSYNIRNTKAYEEDMKNAAIGREFQMVQQAVIQPTTPSRPATSTSNSGASNTPKGTPTSSTKKKEKTTQSAKTQPKEDLIALETEVDSIIEEYLNSADTKETAACLRQLSSPSAAYVFIMRAANFYAEKKDRDRQSIVAVIDSLIKENVISSDDVSKG